MVLRNCLGMIMSVSMFWMGIAAATPVSLLNTLLGSVAEAALAPLLAAVGWMRATGLVAGLLCIDATSAARTSSAGADTSASFSLRTSVRPPVTAAAAAMAGDTRCVRPPLP